MSLMLLSCMQFIAGYYDFNSNHFVFNEVNVELFSKYMLVDSLKMLLTIVQIKYVDFSS